MEKKLSISLELQDKFNEQLKKAFRSAQDQVRQLSFDPKFLQTQQELAKRWQRQGISTPFLPNDKEIKEAQSKSERHMKEMSEKIAKVLDQRRQLEKNITSELKDQNLTLQERERLESLLLRTKQRQIDLTARGAAIEGIDPTKSPKSTIRGAIDSIGGVKAALAAITGSAIYKIALDVGQQLSNAPINIAAMQGSAVAGLTGRQLQQQTSGQFVYETMFSGERQKAMQMAQKQTGRQGILDLFNPMRWLGMVTGEEGARLSQSTTENFNKAFEGLVNQNPYQKAARDLLQQNMPSYLGTQRTLGLGDRGLFDLLNRTTSAGFMPEQGMQAIQGILGAGGSTAMGRTPETALGAMRGLNLTNAPQLLGRISGAMGGARESRDALIEIVSHGLDRSKFAEENRKFTENVAELVNKAGITSKEGVESLSEIMKDFITGTSTQRGIQGGASAFQAISRMGAQTAGYMGAINVASLMKVPGINKIKDPTILEGLAGLGLEDIKSDNVFVQAAAAQMGQDPATFASTLRAQKTGAIRGMVQRPKAFEMGLKEMRSAMTKAAGTPGANITDIMQGFKFETPEGKEALGAVAGMIKQMQPDLDQVGLQQAALGIMREQVLSPEEMQAHPEMQAVKTKMDQEHQKSLDQANEKIDTQKTGRKMDELMSSSADQASISIQNLSKSLDTLVDKANQVNSAIMKGTTTAASVSEAAQRAGQPGLFGAHETVAGGIVSHFNEIVSRNIAAGLPPYTGMSPGQIHILERAKTQLQSTGPSTGR